MRPRPPKSNHFFPHPNNVSMPVWSNSTHWFRRKSADKKLCTRRHDPLQKHYVPTSLFFIFFFFGGGIIWLWLTQWFLRRCLKSVDDAIDEPAYTIIHKTFGCIIRLKICRIKMTYTFEDAVKEDNQIERDFTGLFLCSRPVTQKRFRNAILLWNVSEKTYRTNPHIYRFNFSDAIFDRSRLCRGPNSKKVKLALSLEPYGIVWWNFPCPLILTRSRPRGAKYHCPSIGRGFADVQTVKTWKLPITLEP